MRFYTHIAFSVLIYLIITKTGSFAMASPYWFLAVMLLFTALPDIDTIDSKISREIKILSRVITFLTKHRGMMHSLFPPFILFFVINTFSAEFAFAAAIGYLSHLAADMLTKQGIMFLYPFSKARIHWFIRTGGLVEKVFFIAVLCGITWLLF